MGHILQQILSFSIIVTVIMGMVRFRKITPEYYPFFCLIVAAFINEMVNFVLLYSHHYNIVNTNIYCYVESMILIWQFYRWNLFERNRKTYVLLVTGLTLYWLADNFAFEGLTSHFNSFYIIGYSYLTVILSITLINKQITTFNGSLIRNATFVICTGFIIFFTYATFVEIFWKYGFGGKGFTPYVYTILQYLNALVNVIYAVAFLWIPKKPKFIMLS